MIDLDRRIGPATGRVWGLIINFFANALAVYGAIGVMRDGSRRPLLVTGILVTAVCLILLIEPAREPGPDSRPPAANNRREPPARDGETPPPSPRKGKPE